jgi:hypothetical protein
MAEYKERSITAGAYQRVRAATFIIERGETPRVVFQEEEVLVIAGGSVIKRDVSHCEAGLSGGDIELRNPANGNLTGNTITQAQLYAAIYSLYRQVAAARDQTP